MSDRTVVVLLPHVLDGHASSIAFCKPLLRFAARLVQGRSGYRPVVAALLSEDIAIDTIRRLLPGMRLRLGILEGVGAEEGSNLPVGALLSAWERLLSDIDPICGVLPHTIDGVQLAGALSVRLNAACISGVVDVEPSDTGEPIFDRLVDNGNRVAQVAARAQNVFVTVDWGRWSMKEDRPPISEDTVEVKRLDRAVDRRYRLLDRHTPSGDTRDLDRARVVVAVGRGLGKAENLSHVEAFAATFPGSVVAGSRGACDSGWIPPDRQIGVTGKTVSPEIYFALGISGAPQHLAGMMSSRSVVSINIDPCAPIFSHSDIGIVTDMIPFISAWIDRMSSMMNSQKVHKSHPSRMGETRLFRCIG